MAIDTAAKRKSCIGLATPWNRPGVIPDGSNLSAPQRLHANYLYSGIATGIPPTVTDAFSSPINAGSRVEHADPLSSPINVGSTFGVGNNFASFSSPIRVGSRFVAQTGALYAPRYRR